MPAFRGAPGVLLAKHFGLSRYDYRAPRWLGDAGSFRGRSPPGEPVAARSLIWSKARAAESGFDARLFHSQQVACLEHAPLWGRQNEGRLSRALLEQSGWSEIWPVAERLLGRERWGVVAEWATEISDMWLIVPLISSGVLVGFVILRRRARYRREWEVLGPAEDGRPAGRPAAARMQATEAKLTRPASSMRSTGCRPLLCMI